MGCNQNQDFVPIFVIGAPRSGTSLLTVMLDRHDDVAMTPESKLFHDLPRDWRRRHAPSHVEIMASYLYQTHLDDLELDAGEVLAEFRGYEPAYASYVRCVLECYRRKSGKPRVGEKTPQHLWYVPLVLEWYPLARVLWLVRDGRDTVLAMNRLHRRGVRRASFYWRMYAKMGLEWERRYPNSILRVHFENLVLKPEPTLMRICDFSGLKYCPRMLDTRIKSRTVIDRERSYKEQALAPLDTAKVGVYRRLATPQQLRVMSLIMEPSLKSLGYPATPQISPWYARLKNRLLNIPWSVVYHPSTVLLTDRAEYRKVVARFCNRLFGIDGSVGGFLERGAAAPPPADGSLIESRRRFLGELTPTVAASSAVSPPEPAPIQIPRR